MKKNKLLSVAALSLCLLLTGCDDIAANPSNGDSPLVNFTEGKEYFQGSKAAGQQGCQAAICADP